MSTMAAKTTAQSALFNPTDEHKQLREMLRSFVETEVDPQAVEYNRREEMNVPLFRKLGELGLLGVTADANHGGTGMDAVAAVIAHEELSASDPAFCLSFLAHSMLFVNNLSQNGSEVRALVFCCCSFPIYRERERAVAPSLPQAEAHTYIDTY